MAGEGSLETPMNAVLCRDGGPHNNDLLAAVPDTTWERWRRQIEPVNLQSGQVLADSCGAAQYAYFPTTAIVSLLGRTLGGDSSEVAVIGRDGVVGVSLIMCGEATPHEALVQSPGQAYRLRLAAVRTEFAGGGPALNTLLRYALDLMAQIARVAVCNRHHSVDQRLCRRLLQALDRAESSELVMTQEMASTLLGVRRETVTMAALRLQRAGAIHYNRGHITVLDRSQLERRSCECYAAAKHEAA